MTWLTAPLAEQVGDTGFDTVAVEDEVWFNDRAWYPRCADGTPYTFLVREGDPKKLLIYLEQGGACWTQNTCVGSIAGIPGIAWPANPDPFQTQPDQAVPTYTPTVVLTTDGSGSYTGLTTGILDGADAGNPLIGYTQVVVKYCSGDLHIGSADCDYSGGEPDCKAPPEDGSPYFENVLFPFQVLHRGYDNLNAVLAYVDANYNPKEIVLAGSSAGAYGVRFGRAAVRENWAASQGPEEVAVSALVDSGVGVVDSSLYEQAFGGANVKGGVWGLERTAPKFLRKAIAEALRSGDPLAVPVALDAALAQKWPDDRVGHYSSAFDSVQALFLFISRFEQHPNLWLPLGALIALQTDPELIDLTLEWTLAARTVQLKTSLLPNNKRYLGSGAGHTILVDPGDPRVPETKNLFEEDSAGVPLTEWIADMLGPGENVGDWRNLTCFPFCEPPIPGL